MQENRPHAQPPTYDTRPPAQPSAAALAHLLLQLPLEGRKQLIVVVVAAISHQPLPPPAMTTPRRDMHGQAAEAAAGGSQCSPMPIQSAHPTKALLPHPQRRQGGGGMLAAGPYRLAMRLYCCWK